MEFSNHTPFPALAFESMLADGTPFHTVVLRQTFELRDGALVLSQTQKPLATTDQFYGTPNQSSLAEESDLAPYKPMCDVLVSGTACAPRQRPATRFRIGVKIVAPSRLLDRKTAGSEKVLLEQRLVVTGPRSFVRRSLFLRWANGLLALCTFGSVRRPGWKLTSPELVAELPVRYEHALGGQCRINANDPAAKRVPKVHLLGSEQQAGHPDQGNVPVAHSICEDNPVGTGYAEPWFIRASKATRIAAPQIEPENASLTVPEWIAASKGHSGKVPAGFGPIGKAWLSRRTLAGTFDEQWLAQRHPRLPDDFQFSYWNGANPAMQARHLKGDEAIVLTNLVPAGTPGSQADGDGNTILQLILPGHLPMGWVYTAQALKFSPLLLDTLSVNLSEPAQPEVTLVWRATFLKSAGIDRFEARFAQRADIDRLMTSSAGDDGSGNRPGALHG